MSLVESRSSSARLPEAYLASGSPSFVAFLAAMDSTLLPAGGRGESASERSSDHGLEGVPHGTTIIAVTFPGGVAMAGDRRATAGNIIAQRDIEKVFAADEHTLVGIAGAAGIAIELVRLFQVELEHYEKMEGATLSLEGRANRLAALLRGNLGMAMQGFAVVPLFAGFDIDRDCGRIYSYDVTGGRYEEHNFHAIGSGSMFARGALKKLYRRDFDEAGAVTACVEALYDAADDDSATGGPDLARGILPIVAVVDAEGVRKLNQERMTQVVNTVVATRQDSPDGPNAPLPVVDGD